MPIHSSTSHRDGEQTSNSRNTGLNTLLERVSQLADRNTETEAVLSALSQRGAATATASPCDGGRPT